MVEDGTLFIEETSWEENLVGLLLQLLTPSSVADGLEDKLVWNLTKNDSFSIESQF